jgi:hypothetical protein
MGSRSGPVPDSIKQLGAELQQFRSTHPRRTRLPETLWQTAVEEARQHGIYMVAHTLRLDYANLQKRLGGASTQGRIRGGGEKGGGVSPQRRRSVARGSDVAPAAFMELARSVGVGAEEYVIEFESDGLRMRVRWRGTTPEWSSLLRAWREVAG